jgi:hypothetical protein
MSFTGKRPRYTLEEHQAVVDQVEAHAAANPGGTMKAARDLGIGANRYTYAKNVLKAKADIAPHVEAPAAEGDGDAGGENVDQEPSAPAEGAVDGEDLAELEQQVVRVYVFEGTVAAVADLLARFNA